MLMMLIEEDKTLPYSAGGGAGSNVSLKQYPSFYYRLAYVFNLNGFHPNSSSCKNRLGCACIRLLQTLPKHSSAVLPVAKLFCKRNHQPTNQLIQYIHFQA
jgi:hypothetical protein